MAERSGRASARELARWNGVVVEKGLFAARADNALGGNWKEEEPAPHEGFGRERERAVAKTLWSRLKASIGESATDL